MMSPIQSLRQRVQQVRRDALVVQGVMVAFGLGFIGCTAHAGDPGWYATAWTLALALTLLAPDLAHALLPTGPLMWWFSSIPVASAYSLPAAWCLLGMLTALALLSAVPLGVRIPRELIVRYARRTVVVGGATTLMWALSMLVRQVSGSYVALTVLGFVVIGAATVALDMHLRDSSHTDTTQEGESA